jgi:HPt (histidine-containing phosphotransfer) domain-containing protein
VIRSGGSPRAGGDGFDELQLAFRARLRSERIHYVSLSAALAGAVESPAPIFRDLEFCAHKTRGGAAIFQMPEVAAAACALEQSAATAANSRANDADAAVFAALAALVRLLEQLEGISDPAPICAPVRIVAASSRDTLER